MKIIDVRIEKMRGIKNLFLSFKGKSAVVVGPNGVGKSAMVDAIDFLFTGKINRLTGEGSGSLNKDECIPYIGCAPSEMKVTATLEDNGDTFVVSRSYKGELEIDDEYRTVFDAIRKEADLGLHLLSRKQILRMISSESGKRAEQMRNYIDLTNLNKIHSELKKSYKQFNDKIKSSEGGIEQIRSELANLLDVNEMTDELLLNFINEHRTILAGEHINSVNCNFLDGIAFTQTREDATPTEAMNSIRDYLSGLQPLYNLLSKEHDTLVGLIKSVEEKSKISNGNAIDKLDLVNKGIILMDDTGMCPLCEYDWGHRDRLELFLYQKQQRYKNLKADVESLSDVIRRIEGIITGFKERIKNISPSLNETVPGLYDFFTKSRNRFDFLLRIEISTEGLAEYQKQFENLIIEKNDAALKEKMVDFQKNLEMLVDVQQKTRSESYSILSNISELCYLLSNEENNLKTNKKLKLKSYMILESFEVSYNSVVNEVYDSIKDRFVRNYRNLHPDDVNFNAEIKQKESKMDIKVTFVDDMLYEPHAVHSDGHQDSMGIAMFLALREEFGPDLGFVILDDVLMSIDVDHRLGFCNLLKNQYGDLQHIITTHDDLWSKMLIKMDIVEQENKYEFVNWNFESGTIMLKKGDIWKYYKNFARENFKNAAPIFRKEMEGLYASLCDSFKARVPYNFRGEHTLGEFRSSFQTRANEILGEIIKYAKDDKDKEKFKKIKDKNAVSIQKLEKNTFVINSESHFGTANFSKNDLIEAITLYEEHIKNFVCDVCSKFYKPYSDSKTLRCDCSAFPYGKP